MANDSSPSNKDTETNKSCDFPDEFELDVSFVKFAESQLLTPKKSSDVKIIFSRSEKPEITGKPSRHLIREKSKIFTEKTEESPKNAKLKYPKRETAFIQQKMVNLHQCASKTDEEIFGVELLEAIRKFYDFLEKSWGKQAQNGKDTNKPPTQNNNDQTSNSMNHLPTLLKKRPSSDKTVESELARARDNADGKLISNDTLAGSSICTLYKKNSLPKGEAKPGDQPTDKFAIEFNSKGVNTDMVSHLSIATNTAALENTCTGGGARFEPLSKLTIRTQNPITQQLDCGCRGEGGLSNSLQADIKSEVESLLTKADDFHESDFTQIGSTDISESKIQSHPSDDMKAALDVVNKALIHGRTGRDVAISMSVILHEWFQVVGSRTASAESILNYLRTFSSYSQQLVRYMVNLPDENGITALHYAVSYGNFSVVSKLLETDVIDVNKANKAGYTSIMLASLTEVSTAEQEQVLGRLIERGNVNTRAAQKGQTSLMLAASHGRFIMVKLLVEAGAEVNAQDEDGSTALMYAVEHGHADIVQCLLAQPDCDPNMTDNDELNALNVAMDAGHKDIAVLLYAHMHFFKNSCSLGGLDQNLILSKRSKSAMSTPAGFDLLSEQSRRSDGCSGARKQHSSIN